MKLPLLFVLLVSNCCIAQQLSWQWARNSSVQVRYWSSGSESSISSIASDREGNVYVAGLFTDSIKLDGFAVYTIPKDEFPGNFDIFIAKYNSIGRLVWLKSFGAPESDFISGTAVDEDNNLFITGWYFGSPFTVDDTAIAIPNKSKGYLVRCSPEGNFDWVKVAHFENEGAGFGNISAAGKHLFVHGFTTSSEKILKFGNDEILVEGQFIAKLTTDGEIDWLKPGAGALSILPNGESFVTQGNKVLKYDPEGNQIQMIEITGGDFDAIACNSTLIFAAGNFRDSIKVGDISLTLPPSTVSMFAATYTHDGKLQNLRVGVGPGSDVRSVCADSNGGFYVVGGYLQSIRFDEYIVFADSISSSYIVHFDTNYKASFLITPKKDGLCTLEDISITHNNEVVVSGFFRKSVEFPPYQLSSITSNPDIAIAKLGSAPSSIDKSNAKSSHWFIYPMPAAQAITIGFDLDKPSTVNYSILDLLGRPLLHSSKVILNKGEHQVTIPVSDMINGIYTLILRRGQSIESRNILIAH